MTKSVSKKVKEFNSKVERLRKAFVKEAETLFKEATAEIFASEPKLESFSWTQYTPYFMDGDTCVFGVNDICEINGIGCEDSYGVSEDEDSKSGEVIEIAESKLEKIKSAINEIIFGIPNEYMQDLFGDHMRVTVNRNGKIEKDEYEHE